MPIIAVHVAVRTVSVSVRAIEMAMSIGAAVVQFRLV